MLASESERLVLGELREPQRAGGRQLRAAGSLLARLLTLALFPQQDSLAVTGSRASHLRCVAAEERADLRPPRAAVRARLSQPTTLSSCGALAPAFSLTCSPFALLLSLPLHLARCAAVARANPGAALKVAAVLDLAPLPAALETGQGALDTESDVARKCEASEESYQSGTPERERVYQAARRGGRDGDALVLVRGRAGVRWVVRKVEGVRVLRARGGRQRRLSGR